MAYIKGVDFCHWQANIDFSKLVNNGIKFAIFKAGEIPASSRNEFTDEMYQRNITESKIHHIICGAYYFFHPVISAARQARHFDTVMQKFGQPDLPPVIDVEVEDKMEPDEIASELKAMSDALVSRGYRTPIIYSRWGFLVNKVGEPYWIKNHMLWLAQYSNNLVNKPADMSNVIMWQYTDKLKVPGIGVALDGNYWLKSEEELLQLVKQPEPIVVQIPEPSQEQSLELLPDADQEVLITQVPQDSPQETSQETPQSSQDELPAQMLEQQPEQHPEQPVEFTHDERQEMQSEEPPETANSADSHRGIFEMLVRLIHAIIGARR
ncbi:MAG: GH25 family lysozyme [Pelolinea sp.]|nr:GH25 family lysozyme [Pelolinea sp.]